MVTADACRAIAVGNAPSGAVMGMGALVSREAAVPAAPGRVLPESFGSPQGLAAGAAGLSGGCGHAAPRRGT